MLWLANILWDCADIHRSEHRVHSAKISITIQVASFHHCRFKLDSLSLAHLSILCRTKRIVMVNKDQGREVKWY